MVTGYDKTVIKHHLRYEISLPGTIQYHSGYDIRLRSSKQQHTSYNAFFTPRSRIRPKTDTPF